MPGRCTSYHLPPTISEIGIRVSAKTLYLTRDQASTTSLTGYIQVEEISIAEELYRLGSSTRLWQHQRRLTVEMSTFKSNRKSSAAKMLTSSTSEKCSAFLPSSR